MRLLVGRTAAPVLWLAFAAGVALSCNTAASRADPKEAPLGLWLTQAGDAKVLIRQCGAAICGEVTWLQEPIDSATGKPQRDEQNPDPRLRARPMIGIELFISMLPSAANAWSGRVYNANNGQTYAGSVALRADGRLEVKRCSGPVCLSEMWTRVSR